MLRIISTILMLTLATSASAQKLTGKDASVVFLKGEIIGQNGKEYLIVYKKDLYGCYASVPSGGVILTCSKAS